MKTVSRRRILIARTVAVLADFLQIGLFPLFGEGFLSILNDALDLAVALVMFGLLGWHWALLPSAVAELVPGLNLFPTWTVAVLFATRGRAGGPRSETVPTPPPRQGP